MVRGRQLGLICDGEIELCLLCEDDIEETLEVLRTSFFINEGFCIGTGVNLPENETARNELIVLGRKIIKDGISVIARHINSNKIVGVAINKMHEFCPGNKSVQGEFLNNFIDSCKTENVKCMMKSVDFMEEKFDIFTEWNVDCVVELFMLSVLLEFGNRSIGYNLSFFSMQLLTQLGQDDIGINRDFLPKRLQHCRPKAIYGIFSSIYSYKISKRLGFQDLVVIPLTEFFYKGVQFSDKIDAIHKNCILGAKKF